MISTVTTSTVTTITSVTTAAGLAGALGMVAVLLFLTLLITREMMSAGNGGRAVALRRGLTIGLVPLALTFLMIASSQLVRVLL
jgi:hypothetical protein